MKLKGLIDTDLVNYKKTCMTLMFPYCDMKCNKEHGKPVCQNDTLVNAPDIEVNIGSLIDRYLSNRMTEAVCIQGLEPFDSWDNLFTFISFFREKSDDDIVIYTGYKEDELWDFWIKALKQYKNIIIKFGRFIPGQQPHRDEILGVALASDNQYAEKIS